MAESVQTTSSQSTSASSSSSIQIRQNEEVPSIDLDSMTDRSRFLRRRQKEVDDISIGNLRTQRLRLDRTDSNDNDYVSLANTKPALKASSHLGVSAFSNPTDWEIRRRRHHDLMREVAEDEHRTRILPKPDPLHSWSRMNDFVTDFDERDLRYLTKEGRQTIIRHNHYPTLPAKELPYRAKRKSTYAKFVEGL